MNDREHAVRHFSQSPIHSGIRWQIISIVTLSAAVCCLAVASFSVPVCNYLVPLTLLTGMIVLFNLGIGYQRTVTQLIKDNRLFCGSCHQATIPRPDRIRCKSLKPDHGISVCYHCGTDLTGRP